MTFAELGNAARHLRFREVVRHAVVLLNALSFHLFGTSRRFLGIRDAWQSESCMNREPGKAFTEICVTTGRHFLIEATRH